MPDLRLLPSIFGWSFDLSRSQSGHFWGLREARVQLRIVRRLPGSAGRKMAVARRPSNRSSLYLSVFPGETNSMNALCLKSLLGAGCATLALATTMTSLANAGGFDRGGVNIDLLFDESRFATEAGVTHVAPHRELENVRRLDGSGAATARVKVDDSYTVPRFGIKANVFEPVDCLATYTEPYGADADYGRGKAYSPTSVEFKVDTRDLGLTCSYKIPLEKGSFRLIGGVSYQEVEAFQSRETLQTFALPRPGGLPPLVLHNPGLGVFALSDEAVSWRAGVAYEIPEIAFRASLVYSSRYKYDNLSGTVNTTGFAVGPTGPSNGAFLGVFPVSASTEVPQALELKVQSGIAPGWLAFGSVKWQEWSKLGIIPINGVINPVTGAVSRTTSFDPLYRDGWTVTGGIGHSFTDTLSGAVSVTWDRGTSTSSGYQTDLWNFAVGGSYKPNEHVEVRLGGSLGLWTSGESSFTGGDPANAVSYSFGNDLVTAVSGAIKVRF
ncbi:outer membrane protein transport protein [Pseudaminobacter sp. NGMCC 1.201702]|uniref:outer membrane protein transport protein n=1 Tax=Pseudaminobacter sp. NGMCC 1.201702 TaxID=3391825 RepID=UPI0039EF62F8